MPFYKITLTGRGGLSSDNVTELVKFFSKKCTHAYIVNEFGESGSNSHLEGVIELPGKKTSNVTRSIGNEYLRMDLEVVPRITIVVKAVTHLDGALSYASKELQGKGVLVLLLGWDKDWITTQTKAVVRHKAPSTLLSMGIWLTKRIAPAQIYKWCQSNGREIYSKMEYREVIVRMGDEGYMFDKGVIKCTYGNVMALFGDGRGLGEIFDDEMRFVMQGNH